MPNVPDEFRTHGDHSAVDDGEGEGGNVVFGAPPMTPPDMALREAVERFLADYDDGDRADAGNAPLMEAHVADFRALLSAKQGADTAGEGDLPTRFEAWWASYPHNGRASANYGQKKQIAFDAFEAAQPTTIAADGDKVLVAALNQNDTMRQELTHVGNLISHLERAMRVEPANADGTWPDLAGRICKLIAASPPQTEEEDG
jgi:hypothetical protein